MVKKYEGSVYGRLIRIMILKDYYICIVECDDGYMECKVAKDLCKNIFSYVGHYVIVNGLVSYWTESKKTICIDATEIRKIS